MCLCADVFFWWHVGSVVLVENKPGADRMLPTPRSFDHLSGCLLIFLSVRLGVCMCGVQRFAISLGV